jgi:hypothetical protein
MKLLITLHDQFTLFIVVVVVVVVAAVVVVKNALLKKVALSNLWDITTKFWSRHHVL